MNGFKQTKKSQNINFLYNVVAKTFNIELDKDKIKEWHGTRPFRPNSIPLIGQINELDNLYLNTGHGSLGWTNCLSSGKISADLILENYNFNKIYEQFNFLFEELKNIFKNPHS
jgi:D-amino-acid dehydrogenase